MQTLELFAPDYDAHQPAEFHQGARIIGVKNGEIALLHYDLWQLYVLPGGGIEENETALEAVHRETLEETGYQLTNVQEILVIKEHFVGSIWHHTYFTATFKEPASEVKWTDEEIKLGITLQFFKPLEALEKLSSTEGNHPYAENMMNREFLALTEAINQLNMKI